ncbi:MAG TPA: hypothetical protein PKV73_01105 [Agriterribacter sp.]|nr:hypothetical protein [Agriterribacter sp.]
MQRRQYIEQIRRLIYGGMPDTDAEITVGLVNIYVDQAIAFAAKQNYKDNIALDGIAYVNNSFYSTFKGISVSEDEQFVWKIELPQIPVGIGANEGLSTLVLRDYESRQLTYPIVWMTQNQRSIFRGMRTIPNKLIGYSEGKYAYLLSTLTLSDYTAQVTMISGGDSTDLDSELNVPSDYIPGMTDYLMKVLMAGRVAPKDLAADGNDFINQA